MSRAQCPQKTVENVEVPEQRHGRETTAPNGQLLRLLRTTCPSERPSFSEKWISECQAVDPGEIPSLPFSCAGKSSATVRVMKERATARSLATSCSPEAVR